MNLKDFEFIRQKSGIFVGRAVTKDVAYTFRMPGGFAGEANRTHPVSIISEKFDGTNYPTAFGMPLILDSSSHLPRKFLSTEKNTTGVYPYGVVVRPYPGQGTPAATYGAPETFGVGAPPSNQIGDVLTWGYVKVQLGDGQITGAVKGGAVYIWCDTAAGHDLTGYFTTTTTSGSVAALDTNHFMWNGVQDASGIVELKFKV